MDKLNEMSIKCGISWKLQEFASYMDSEDCLARFRQEFHYPKVKTLPGVDFSVVNENNDSVYLCGNSLGLLPKRAQTYIDRELRKWAEMGVHGHFLGEMPWARCEHCVDGLSAELVGAHLDEVAIANGLTVNQHLLLLSFYKPTVQRFKILLEGRAFPSDHYAVQSQIVLKGLDPSTAMLVVRPREGEHCVRTEDLLEIIEKEGETIAIIMLPGVQYYTGQLFDMQKITEAGHRKLSGA